MAPEASATHVPGGRRKSRDKTREITALFANYDVGIGGSMPESSFGGHCRHFGSEIVQRANTGVSETL